MSAARPHDDREVQFGRERNEFRLRLGNRQYLCARHAQRCRNFEPVDAAQQAMQLVAIEVADEARRVEQRPRPARRRLHRSCAAPRRIPPNPRRSRSPRHVREAASANRRPRPHRASGARCRNSRAGIRSGCCRPCRSRPPAPARAISAVPTNRATGKADEQARTSAWSANPVCLSPKSCVISARSRPSPALAVPLASLPINWSRSGRRSPPSNAILVSRAKPIRSALG